MSNMQQLRTQAMAHLSTGQAAEAEAAFATLSAKIPQDADIHWQHGVSLEMLARDDDAVQAYRRAIAAEPRHTAALFQLATLLRRHRRWNEALATYASCAALAPQEPQVFVQRAGCNFESGDLSAALSDYETALSLIARAERADPRLSLPDILFNHALTLERLGREVEAMATYERVLVLAPGMATAWNNRGGLLRRAGKMEEAEASFHHALGLDPQHLLARANRGMALMSLGRTREAAADFQRLWEIDPGNIHAQGGLLSAALASCDWDTVNRLKPLLKPGLASGKALVAPLYLLQAYDDPALLHDATVHFRRTFLPLTKPRPPLRHKDDGRIRLAYLSADYRDHPVAYLMADLFAQHDRKRFEILAISYGANDSCPTRDRLERSADRFIDVQTLSDEQVAAQLRDLGVDIAIDLTGYTQWSRTDILTYGAAPVQVNWLGYPGTLGGDFCDYIIADPVTAPHTEQPFFSEKIVHLPDTYQINDPRRPHETAPSRLEAGLPETGLVFGCFNTQSKIGAPEFMAWMRLLEKVPGSVLWLLDGGAADALRGHATRAGIAPDRLIFAPRVPAVAHLRRLALADMMLDTLPYGMHTTASDALWMGVPVITCRGRSFAGRVAAGLVSAMECPELIAETPQDYEALALALARDPARLAALRQKLADKRLNAPLFDAARFTRHLEQAYATMMDIARAGEAPRAFAVTAS